MPLSREAVEAEALAAERSAGVKISSIASVSDADEVYRLAEELWGGAVAPPKNVVRALGHAGSGSFIARTYLSTLAEPVGFALGWVGWNGGLHLHSHQVGVSRKWQSHGVGYALKLRQRAKCREEGIDRITWTFDPLLVRNARFNLARLGAMPVSFYPDFYGRRGDLITGLDASDRFEVEWIVGQRVGESASNCSARVPQQALLDVGGDGFPVRGGRMQKGGYIRVPESYAAWRSSGDPRVAPWRLESRAVFEEAFGCGLRIVGFRDSSYLCVQGGPEE